MRFELALGAWALVLVLTAGYLGHGALSDISTVVTARRRRRVLDLLSVVLFEPDDDAARVYADVQDLPRGPLLAVIQSLAVDLDGEARERLQQLVRATGIERFVRRRVRSFRWRMRVQVAQLQYLVTHPDFDRSRLLHDKHPLVRARAAESLTKSQAISVLDDLMTLLDDEAVVVRLAAQETVLTAGAAAVPMLVERLTSGEANALEALEVAANLPDPRLLGALDEHASSKDDATRETAARALGNGNGDGTAEILERLTTDTVSSVRVAAIESLARSGSVRSVGYLGRALSDRSWHVRRAAGLALDVLGAPGRLLLRRHLTDPDPYARDMARQVLDAIAARTGLEVVPRPDDPLEDLGLDSLPTPVSDVSEIDVMAYDVSSIERAVADAAEEALEDFAETGAVSSAGPLVDDDVSSVMFVALAADDLLEALLTSPAPDGGPSSDADLEGGLT